MITIHNFNEAHHMYQSSLIPYRLLQDQAQVLLSLTVNPTVVNAYEITEDNINWLMMQPDVMADYATMLGGHFYICECEADLKEIKGCDFEWAETHDGQWPNVTDIAMSWDACSYLDEIDDDPQWVIFLLCWNNAGGPIYYVPRHLWVQARVVEHIAAIN
jgi:hypothetical protein